MWNTTHVVSRIEINKRKMALLPVLLIVALIGTVSSLTASLTVDKPTKDLFQGDSVELEWTSSTSFSNASFIFRLTISVPSATNFIIGNKISFVIDEAVNPFGKRLAVEKPVINVHSQYVYSMTLKDLYINDSMKFAGEFLVFSGRNVVDEATSSILLVVNARPTSKPPSSGSGIKGGVVAAIVIAVIIAIVIVAVIVYYFVRREKKDKPVTPVPSENLGLQHGRGYGSNVDGEQYAPAGTGVPQDTKKQPEVYSQVGHGGGRKVDENEPREKQPPVLYSQVKTDEDGYPATGPRTTPAPPKPVHGKLRKNEEQDVSDSIMI